MKQKLPLELAPGSLLRKAGVALLTFLFPSAYGPLAKYRPQDHYMRGPGPKWREKHGRNKEAAGFVQRPVILNDKWDR